MFAKRFCGSFEIISTKDRSENGFVCVVRGFRAVRVAPLMIHGWDYSE
jgi:hypothetical protein